MDQSVLTTLIWLWPLVAAAIVGLLPWSRRGAATSDRLRMDFVRCLDLHRPYGTNPKFKAPVASQYELRFPIERCGVPGREFQQHRYD